MDWYGTVELRHASQDEVQRDVQPAKDANISAMFSMLQKIL